MNFRLSIDCAEEQSGIHDEREKMVRERMTRKGGRGRKKKSRILRGIYIAFKSLERLIIIVIISRRNIGEKRTDTARMRACMRG